MKPQPITTRSARSQRGEGNLGNLVKLAIFAILGLAGYQVAPIYMANFKFTDSLAAFVKRFPPNQAGDVQAMEALPLVIEEAGLSQWVSASDCTVRFDGGKGGGQRTVRCPYKRPYKVLGQDRVAEFENEVTQPVF